MKKFIAVLLCIVTLALQIPFMASAATTGVLYGDADSNGHVTIVDATKIQKYLIEKESMTDTEKVASDVSGDGDISITDVTLIQKYLSQMITVFPVEETPESDTLVVDYSAFENREHTADEQLYTQLFDPNSSISVEINISDEELQKIQDDYVKYDDMGSKSPIYRKADSVVFTINNVSYTVDEVGVRMKGNTSRTDFFENGEMTNLVHFKLDFGETFDDEEYYGADAKVWEDSAERKARKNRTFATLEKIDLKWNSTYDSTYTRQNYNYEMFRDYGMLAAHCNAAATTIGDTYCGIYSLNEPIDDIFLEKYLPADEQGGDLYKCGWTMTGANFTSNCSIGAEDEDKGLFYNYDIKTNKKTTTHEALNKLISVVNSSSLDNEGFESVVDKDSFVKFAALSYFSGNADDMRNCYNNYYVYFRPNGKAVFIPYDFDRCLGVTYGADPSGNGMTQVSPYSNEALLQRETQKNPIYKYAISQTGAYKNEYTAELNKIVDGKWLDYNNYLPYYNAVKENYSNLYKPSKSFMNVNANYIKLSDSTVNMSVSDFMSRITSYYKSLATDPTQPATGATTPTIPRENSTFTINVTLPENTPTTDTLYVSSNSNNWSVANADYAMTRTSDTTATITFDSTDFVGQTLQFKLTRGNWETCECLADGSEYIGGSTRHHDILVNSGNQVYNYTVEAWTDLIIL